MAAKLFCKTGPLSGNEFLIDRDATIGSGPSNTIVLSSRTISREHARIGVDGQGRYVLTDLRSSNGTQIDKRPVRGPELLGDLHVITFATHDFVFQVSAAREVSPRAKTEASDRRMAADRTRGLVAPQRSHEPADSDSAATCRELEPALVVPSDFGAGVSTRIEPVAEPHTEWHATTHLSVPTAIGADSLTDPQGAPDTEHLPPELAMPPGSREDFIPTAVGPVPIGQGAAVPRYWHLEIYDKSTGARVSRRLSEGEHRFGRGAVCEVRIDNRTLSRVHTLLTVRDRRLTILDMGSANGTMVDDVLLDGTVEAREGMTLSFGEVTARLVLKPDTGSSE